MTKVPQGFDFSFLNDEEARKILQVLERNEELQRADKDRISKLQKTKRDIRWLQGVTGEWFEEIQRKKFCNETDVSQMLKQPLTYRLREGMAENDRVELQTSRSKTTPHQRNPMSVSSRLSFRSFSSLFSFRKSRRETSKLLSPAQKGGGLSSMSVSVPVPPRAACQEVLFKQQAKIYSSSVENRPADSVFVPGRAGMREGSGMPPWDASQLENEFFQVLDDLDNKLAQEQCPSSGNTTAPLNYGSRAQCSHFYSRGNTHGNITGRYQNHHNGASNMSIYDILRPGTPREGFKTFSPRTKTIYDMYRTREPRLSKEDYVQKNSFGSTSLCFDSRQPSTSPATIYFTTRSLHFPTITQNKSGFIPPRHQQSPKRTPLSSIIWNRSDTSGGRQSHEEFLGAPSPMEIDSADQYVYPRCFQENRRYEFYRSQSVYQGVHLDTYMDNAMSPDPFENSENMPFYHQEHPFARPFSSNTFGRNREQRFKQSPLWGQHEEHSFWSDFPQSRHPFTSHRDSEMISMEVAAGHSHSIHSQHWGPFSPGYKTNIFRGHEEPHLWQFDSQTTTLESTEVSRGNESQTTHFSMPNVCPGMGPSYHSTSGRSACQQGGPPTEVHLDKEPYSFGNTQTTLAYSFSTSFPPIPDDRGNPQRPSFQDPTVAVHKIKPASLPIKSYTEVTVTKSDSVDSPPLTESPPSILVTQVTKEKVLKESLREEDKQLHKMDRTHMTSEVPQPVSQTVTSNHASDVQNPLSQDSAEGKGFAFNASTTVSSKRSPGVISRKESPKIHISHRERSNELKKDKNHTGDRKLGSATSLAFVQERTTASWPSPDQGCHQEVRASTEAISGIIKNNHWSSGPADGQKAQSAEKPAISDTKEEQGTTSPSTNCSKPAARRKIPRDSSDLSSGILPGSSPSNNSFLDTPAIPSTTVFSRKSPSGKDPSPGERAQKDNDSKDQSDQFALSPSENPKRNDECVLVHNEAVDVAKWRSPSPFKDGKGKGKVRRRIASLEKLSKMERRSAPTSDNSSSMEMNQSNSKPPEVHTTSCTSPTKSARFLINNRKSESKIMASPCRNEPLPFQVKNNVEHPAGKYTLNKFGPTSSESESKCSKAVSDSVPVAPEATEKVTNLKNIGFASVRKGPLPFLIKRAVSCPSGVPDASDGRDKREECLVSNTDDSAVTLKPWEAIISPLENNSPVSDLSWPKRHHQKQYFPECTEKDGKIAASGTGLFSLSNEDPLPFSSDASRKESGKTLRKFKTTSTFSVSGDEDNVKCLEVVSVYYTLPRKYSKKFSNILEKYTRYIDSLTESTKVETETFPNAFEKEKLNYSTQEQSGTPSSEGLKMLVTSAQEKTHCLSHTSENMTVSQLPSLWPSEPTLQEVDSTEARVSLHKRESKTGGISPDNFAKTPLGDSESRKERGKRSQSETLPPSSMLQEKKVTEEKAENCQQSSKSGNSGPSNLPAHSEENVGSSQNGRSSGECVGTRIAITAPGTGEGLPREIADGSSNGLQPSQVRGEIGTDFQKETSKPLSDLESQVFALTPALHKLQLFEGTCSGEPDLDSLQSEPRELPPRSQEISMTENSKAEDEMLKLAWDQPSFPGGNSKQKTSLDDPEKGKNRSVVKHRLAAMSKASRKFPAKDLSPRRHVATIFPQSGNSSGFGSLSLGTAECNLPSPEPTPKSIESRNESRLSCDITDVEKSENSLQVPVIPSREASTHLSNPKSNSISQLQQNGDKNISESSPKYEKSKDVTAAQTLERESRTLAQPTFPNLGEADFSDHQRRINPPFPLEPTEKSRVSIPLASYQQQQRSASSLEWGPELHPYRSNSLKSINVHGDLVRKSHPPKVRGRHFSESTSIDNALSELTLGDEFSGNSGYSRRFSSFSELSSCDGNENRILGGGRTKMGPKFATSISRPIDYGIFGKEQQLAFLENVKRSLTQGRLWKPSFLKNPGFLKDDVINHPQPTELPSSDSPSGQMPEDALSPGAPLCIYEKTPVDSDCDTDTTTDDEYYLDENDKESEL